MITNDQTIVERKVPFLGDIPLIGRLFRYDLNRHKRKELLVFLTPTVLDDDGTNESIKSKETGLINMPAEAFSFGDNLTGTYANPANAVEVPMLPLAPDANGDFGQPGPNGQPVQNGFETGYPPPNQPHGNPRQYPCRRPNNLHFHCGDIPWGSLLSQSDNTGRFALQNGTPLMNRMVSSQRITKLLPTNIPNREPSGFALLT